QMAEDVVKTLDENFFYSKKRNVYTFIHIYKDHILKDVSKKTGEKPFYLHEVIKAKKEGELIKYGGDIICLWKTPDGRILHLVLREEDLKIVTAYRIDKRKYMKIVRDGEKFAR
ncbi:hypothetical protein DRP05_13680, partial [Archaeoglobales archaeon]